MSRLKRTYQLLIADDDPAFRETLSEIFDPFFQTIVADCGEHALEMVQDCPIDIALLDMHMRQLTGLETIRALKLINRVAPCILITADYTRELAANAAEADAFSVLSKPVGRRDLVSTVSDAIGDAYDDPDIQARLHA